MEEENALQSIIDPLSHTHVGTTLGVLDWR